MADVFNNERETDEKAQSWINIYEINSDIIIKILEAFKHRALKNSKITLNQRKSSYPSLLDLQGYSYSL